MKTVKIGLIGCGRISKNHLDAVTQIPEAEFVAACDIVEEKMQAIAENYGIKNLFILTTMKMLKKEKLDLVSICTPSGQILKWVLMLLNHKINVLTENLWLLILNQLML